MSLTLRSAVEAALGCQVRSMRPLAGGDICQAYRTELDDGRQIFVKTRHPAPKGMFEAEARGLRWLAETGALRVPEVVAHSETFLILEHLESRSRSANFDQTLGEGLAALHRFPTEGMTIITPDPQIQRYPMLTVWK